MNLPLQPPIEPMLAKAVPTLPEEPGMAYEPKWDGFRIIVFRDGDEIELGSRTEKPMTRYFPEVVSHVREHFPPRCVVDCELVVIRRGSGLPRLDFELLQQRIHPAASRVRKLAEETPADMIIFDILALDDQVLMELEYARRRETLFKTFSSVPSPAHLTPQTFDAGRARQRFVEFEGAGLDGLIAKPATMPYVPGKRLMYKVKHARTADAVEGQRLPGAISRWSAGKDLAFIPLEPVLVVEVGYESMEGPRFRHTAQFKRWRPDRDPRSCTYEQLERPLSLSVDDVLS